MKISFPAALLGAAIASLLQSQALVHAHGFVGTRFFPATLTTDDPLVTDELAFPSFSFFTEPGGGGDPQTRTITAGFEFNKLILPKLSLGIADNYLWQQPKNAPSSRGWGNLSLSVKYEVWRDEAHEAIISVGLETDLGGTGSRSVGRDPYTTFTPTLYLGKGLGDLPDDLWFAKPFAITATIGQNIPTSAVPCSLDWGIAVQYNIPYLQQHVKDLGLPEPFRSMIPVVEFTMNTPENRGPLGVTTGTVNPGVLWESRYMQVGIEALLPINGESGHHVGAMMTVEIYIDDLFPALFGHPIFGG